MKVITTNELDDFFNTPRQRESRAHLAKIKAECVETQATREARLEATHDYDDCMFCDCWICDTAARERFEDLQDGRKG